MAKKNIDKVIVDKQIEKGEIAPVQIPQFVSISEIVKFQFCTEIIQYKKRENLKQIDIAEIIDVNKSEVSKLFSYNLKEFSQERILSFIEALLAHGADINLDTSWDQIKSKSKKLGPKLGRIPRAMEA